MVYSYQIFHLDRTSLYTGEYGLEAKQSYEMLLSNTPRDIDDLREAYGSSKLSVEEQIEKLSEDESLHTKIRLERKQRIANELFADEKYILAAEVNAKNIYEAIEITTHMNTPWYENKNKKINPSHNSLRSTLPYDIIESFGKRYLYLHTTIMNLDTGEIVDKFV